MTQKPRKGDFRELKLKKFTRGAHPRTPLETPRSAPGQPPVSLIQLLVYVVTLPDNNPIVLRVYSYCIVVSCKGPSHKFWPWINLRKLPGALKTPLNEPKVKTWEATYMRSGLYRWMMAQKPSPLRHDADMSLIFTFLYFLVCSWHHFRSIRALTKRKRFKMMTVFLTVHLCWEWMILRIFKNIIRL